MSRVPLLRRTALALGVVLVVFTVDGGCRPGDDDTVPSPSGYPTATITSTTTSSTTTTTSTTTTAGQAPDPTNGGPTTVAPPLDPDDPTYPTIVPRPVPSYPDAGR